MHAETVESTAGQEISVDRLLAAFQRFQGQNEQLTSEFVRAYGVGATELRALLVLNVYESVNLKRLGQLIGQIPSAVTFLVDRLEKAGYLLRRPNPGDRRSLLVSLTAHGQEVVVHIWGRYREVFRSVVSHDDTERLTQ